ncbi:MAG: hypothetical protein HFJ11_05345 [Bacilli bacterium]|nr:hypothetical protein [Bacilli bacterium]
MFDNTRTLNTKKKIKKLLIIGGNERIFIFIISKYHLNTLKRYEKIYILRIRIVIKSK